MSATMLPFYIQRSCPVERATCTNGNLGTQSPFAPESTGWLQCNKYAGFYSIMPITMTIQAILKMYTALA